MKRKADFVTNSSTCSFLVVGWEILKEKIPDKMKDEDGYPDWDKYSNIGVEVLIGTEMGASSNNHMIVGDYWKADEYETTKISINDILKIRENSKVRDLFNIPEDEDPSIFIGEKVC